MLQAIATDRTISAHAAFRPALLIEARDGFADTGAGKTSVGYKYVSAGYFDVLGIPIVRGRSFTAAERDEHPVVIVSESIARALWPNRDGVGETFRLEADLTTGTWPSNEVPPPPRIVTVVGISRDVPGFRFTDVRDADMFLPTSLDAPNTSIVARVNGDPDLARQTLLDHLTRIDPNMGMIVTMRTVARLEIVLAGDRFLGVAGSWRARAVADGVGAVQRVVVPRRAAHQGDWRADGAGRLLTAGDAVDAVAGHAAGDVRVARRRRIRRHTRDRADRHAGWRPHRQDRARHRPGGLCGQR